MDAENLRALRSQLAVASEYPRNLKSLSCIEYKESLQRQFEKRCPHLFREESEASASTKPAVELWELNNDQEAQKSTELFTAGALATHLEHPPSVHQYEPMRRCMFIHAPNARKPLNITKEMFLQISTWHIVMPSFREFLLPFGKQERSGDFHMGFRSDSRMSKSSRRFPLQDIGRSGRHLECCYSLKSVEPTGKDENEPSQDWSVRQCSVHFSFDLETEQSTWIVVKGNKVISEAIKRHTNESRSQSGHKDLFASALAIHRILAEWTTDNWSWYTSDLERFLHAKTQAALSASEKVQLYPSSETLAKDDNENEPKPISKKSRTFSFKQVGRALSFSTLRKTPKRQSTLASQMAVPIAEAMGFDNFSFRDLQHVQAVEEKANEMLTILRANSRILKDLNREYQTLMSLFSEQPSTDTDFDKKTQDRWRTEINAFNNYIFSVDHDLTMQQARTESLLRLVEQRKALLLSILQYRSMQASKLYAENAQNSAFRMEDITRDMHTLAEKTKVETVSMRIITWVTLFFLPGTFISTLMSTPIVHFDTTKPDFHLSNIGFGALKLYLVISLPLVLLTLLAYGSVLLYDKYKEKRRQDKLDNERSLGNEKLLDRPDS